MAENPLIQEFLAQVGIKPQGGMRGQADIIGFASEAKQMSEVVRQCALLAEVKNIELNRTYGWSDKEVFIAGICPHDDYYYAGRLYHLMLPKIKANTVLIFGVFHKAKYFGIENKLVFDDFTSWRSPNGSIKVSPLREEIISQLPPDYFTIDNDAHSVEHSVEPIAFYLQALNPELQILPILVPYMDWTNMGEIGEELAKILQEIIIRNGWELGKDLAIICSSDAIHYGDAGWGDANYADFGCDIQGYGKAVDRDVNLAKDLLAGKMETAKLRQFLYNCVEEGDIKKYKLTWCGRFSLPFGLKVANQLSESLLGRNIQGYLLDYGDSLSEISLDLEGLSPMGATAPNNLHHWVGYMAMIYR
jgi:AmmeMemoRadiSam system protein B